MTRSFLLGITGAYIFGTLILSIFPNQIVDVLATVTAFSADNIREDYWQFYYYITLAFLIAGSLLLLARRWRGRTSGPVAAPVRRARVLALAATAALVPVVGVAYAAREWLGLGVLFVEDGPSEWFTALVFFAAAAVLGIRALQARAPGRRLAVALYGLTAILAAFIALEEISYGQRLFGMSTPDWLAHANDQGEISVHNLHNALMLNAYRVAGLALFAVMLAGAWWWQDLRRARGVWREIIDFLPDPALLPLAAVIAVVAQHPGFNELVEIFAVLLLLFYIAWPQHAPAPLPEHARLARGSHPARATGVTGSTATPTR